MCYSALVNQSLKNLGLRFKARVDTALFAELFRKREAGAKIGMARALELNFRLAETAQEREIQESIERYGRALRVKTEQELFAQRRRLADAGRKLSDKATRTAEKEKGIAERQVERLLRKLERLGDAEPQESDSRIYAFDWAPVLLVRNGERVIVPMRYHLRPPGAPEDFDRKYPGCYNARRDSLTGYWRRQFGKKHAALLVTSFFENVKLHDFERRGLRAGEAEENRVIQFRPRGHDLMVVPCIWDHWKGPGSSLDSFALITDEPPREVAETGHNRCPIFLREDNLQGWLEPEGRSDEELFALLDDRERPFYEHALAA